MGGKWETAQAGAGLVRAHLSACVFASLCISVICAHVGVVLCSAILSPRCERVRGAADDNRTYAHTHTKIYTSRSQSPRGFFGKLLAADRWTESPN